MKRRLLSLLLVMAMLLSMVPFQAFAEEAEEAPVLLEETEDIVSEPTEETVPETTEEIIPETTEETVPAITEETTPEVSEEAPVLLEEPEQAEATVPAEGDGETVVTMYANETLDLAERWPGCTYSIVSGAQYATLDGSILTPVEELQIPEDLDYVEVSVDVDNGEESVTILVKIYPAKATLPLMILEGMEPGEDMPQKRLRVGDDFQLKARLTEGSEINEGLAWHLDGNPKYGDCQPIIVQPDGTVTYNTAFDFDETGTSAGGAWAMVVAQQVVKEGEEKTVADTPAVIAMFPELALDMYIGDDKFEKEGTINAVNGFKPVSITAFPKDFGPFGGVTLTLDDSNKVLKSAKKATDHIDGPDCDTEVYTVTPKKCGTFTITATAKDNPAVTLTTTVTVVNETREINIKVPASARFLEAESEKGVIMTAGQKLALSTDIPKTAADKAVTWEIVDPTPVLESIAPEGAVVAEPEWESVVSIDEKGVLRTNAGVTMEPVTVGVRVCLTSTAGDEEPVEDYLMVMIQPPVETLFVKPIPLRGIDFSSSSDIQEFMDGGTNFQFTDGYYPINEGPALLIPLGISEAGGSQPFLYPDISWKLSGSKKVVEFKTVDEYFGDVEITGQQGQIFKLLRALDARVMIPKAPGKASFTATSKDGSGAKFSASFNLFGQYFADACISAPKDFDPSKPLHPGDQVQFTSEAYYYEGTPATDAQRYWRVYSQDWRANDFATIDQKGKLTITDRVNKSAQLTVECYLYNKEGVADVATYSVKVEPTNEKTLGLHSYRDGLLNTAYPCIYEPNEEIMLLPVWVDNDGRLVMDGDAPAAVEGVSYKVSGSACAFDQATGKLTFKKIGTTKLTVTATLDGKKQSFTYTFRCEYLTRKTEIQNKPESGVITVVGGKSLTLKVVNWNDEAKTKKATDQSIWWDLHGSYAEINEKTGKLTTDKVFQPQEVTVYARCAGVAASDYTSVEDSVKILIIPEKTQYRSYADFIYNEDKTYGDGNYFYLTGGEQTLKISDVFEYEVLSYGVFAYSEITGLTSSNPKIAEIVNDDAGKPISIRIPADAKPGKVTFTIEGKVRVGPDGQENPVFLEAPSVKVTVNVVKPVTSITITRPTDKDGNDLPLYVGKSLKLSAVINGRDGEVPATNKKLVWHISYEKPVDPRDDRGLNYLDKTTIKNGVIKVDKSTLTMSRFYYVWATSEDGNAVSNLLEIQAYAMTGAINIASYGDWPDGEDGEDVEYVEYLNNRTITIKQGEELEFGALVYDVNGNDYGANPDITWTISGKKNIVETLYDGLYEGDWPDVLGLKGLNPGTVTIKATAKDGSKKTATFKLVVEEAKRDVLSLPGSSNVMEFAPGEQYMLPPVAYNYEDSSPMHRAYPQDLMWSSDYDKVVPKIVHNPETREFSWLVIVADDAVQGTDVTFTIQDVRQNISDYQRAEPITFKAIVQQSSTEIQ